MEDAQLLSIAIAFLLGLGLSAGVAIAWVARIRSAQKTELDNSVENKVNELRSRFELEFEKRKLDLDRSLAEQRLSLKASEDEVSAVRAQTEKELQMAEKRRSDLDQHMAEFEKKEQEYRELAGKYRIALKEISKVTESEARSKLFEEVNRDCEAELRNMKGEMLQRSEKEVEAEARRILIDSMQRLSAVPHVDITATIVSIPSEDMKGRIIGREGRNIKSFESLTGTTLLIDETPDSVLVSSFDPVRREIARIST